MVVVGDRGPARKVMVALAALSVLAAALSLTYEHVLPGALVRLAAAGVVAGLFGLLILGYPKVGVVIAVFYIYASLTPFLGFPLSYPIVTLVAVAVVLQLLRGSPWRLRDTSFNWSIAVFSLLAVGSMVFSYDVGRSLKSWAQFLKVLVMVWLIVQLLDSQRDLNRLAMAIFAGSIASVILGTYQLMTGGIADASIVSDLGVIRFAGTHQNSNNAALYMTTSLPAGVYLLKTHRAMLARVALAAGTLLLFLAAVFSFSRQAIFPISFVVFAVLVREAKSRRAQAFILVMAFVGLLLIPSAYWERLMSIFRVSETTPDHSLYLRLQALKLSWKIFLDNPLTGIGLHNFATRAGTDIFYKIGVHNTYMEIVVGLGVMGLAAFVWIHASGVRALRRALRATRVPGSRDLNAFSYYCLVSLLAALLGATFQSIPFYYVIWVPLGAAFAADALARMPAPAQKEPQR